MLRFIKKLLSLFLVFNHLFMVVAQAAGVAQVIANDNRTDNFQEISSQQVEEVNRINRQQRRVYNYKKKSLLEIAAASSGRDIKLSFGKGLGQRTAFIKINGKSVFISPALISSYKELSNIKDRKEDSLGVRITLEDNVTKVDYYWNGGIIIQGDDSGNSGKKLQNLNLETTGDVHVGAHVWDVCLLKPKS